MINTRSTARFVGLTLTMAALATSGCGTSPSGIRGGGDGGGFNIDNSLSGAQRAGVQRAAVKAARNSPRAGSVTQSSNANSGVTTDQVSVNVVRDADGTMSYRVSFAEAKWRTRGALGFPRLDLNRGNARVLAEPQGEGWKGIEFHSAPEGGPGSGTGPGLYVDVYTDIEAPTGSVQDADYLAGGIWVWVPPDATSVDDFHFGAFVDGNDPFQQANLAALTGSATYTGDATAVYSYQPTERNYFVDGDVRLTADFGDASNLGSISGAITNIRGEGPSAGWYDGVSVRLGTAPIGSANSGFFTGDTSTSGTDSAFTGKWGGQFYGNAGVGAAPGSVAGTFGGATADGRESFVGVFGAYLPGTPGTPPP